MPIQSRPLGEECERVIRRALTIATARKHQYAMLEHMLMAFLDEEIVTKAFSEWGIDLVVLRRRLNGYLDYNMTGLVVDNLTCARPTIGFRRVCERASVYPKQEGREEMEIEDLLISFAAEENQQNNSFAIWILRELMAP